MPTNIASFMRKAADLRRMKYVSTMPNQSTSSSAWLLWTIRAPGSPDLAPGHLPVADGA
ncbi:MAG: hypothetical protein GTO49_08075 [Anaerolineae bacterium]|nr:hypothetical protein [Anaerolineae bacterium]